MISLTCRILKKMQINLFIKTKQSKKRSRHREQSYQKGKGRRDKLGVWDSQIHSSVYEKIDSQQGPAVQRTIYSVSVINCNRRGSEKEYV